MRSSQVPLIHAARSHCTLEHPEWLGPTSDEPLQTGIAREVIQTTTGNGRGGFGRPGRPGATDNLQRLALANTRKLAFDIACEYRDLTNPGGDALTTKNAGAAATATDVKLSLKAHHLQYVDTTPMSFAASGEWAHV